MKIDSAWISHLLFADDLMVFIKDDCDSVNNLNKVFIDFREIMGLSLTEKGLELRKERVLFGSLTMFS